jgi:hypothetical protein
MQRIVSFAILMLVVSYTVPAFTQPPREVGSPYHTSHSGMNITAHDLATMHERVIHDMKSPTFNYADYCSEVPNSGTYGVPFLYSGSDKFACRIKHAPEYVILFHINAWSADDIHKELQALQALEENGLSIAPTDFKTLQVHLFDSIARKTENRILLPGYIQSWLDHESFTSWIEIRQFGTEIKPESFSPQARNRLCEDLGKIKVLTHKGWIIIDHQGFVERESGRIIFIDPRKFRLKYSENESGFKEWEKQVEGAYNLMGCAKLHESEVKAPAVKDLPH